MEFKGEWLALIGFSWAFWNVPKRDNWIGWNEEQKLKRMKYIAQNTRFLIMPEIRVKNLASYALNQCTKRLSGDFLKIYGYPVFLVETFVDKAKYKGTSYKACGWENIGETGGYTKKHTGYYYTGEKKLILIKELIKDSREILKKEYPTYHYYKPLERKRMINVSELSFEGENGLLAVFNEIKDPRDGHGKRHLLSSILAVSILAVLSGADSFRGIERWVKLLGRETLKKLKFKRGKAPSESAIRKLLQRLDGQEVDDKVFCWLAKQTKEILDYISVDGKTLRGSHAKDKRAVQLLSAVLHKEGITISQVEVEEKTNEIPKIKDIFKNINIEGSVITADALHTQRGTAKFLIEQKGADFIFPVKENQKGLYEDINALDEASFSPGAY